MRCELVQTQTGDGIRLHGALFESNLQPRQKQTLLIFVPGVGGNFYQSKLMEKSLPSMLEKGYSILTVNTRGHDYVFAHANPGGIPWYGSAFERVKDCAQDIDAWIKLAEKHGFAKIGLWGHSLGAIKSIYSQAHSPNRAVQFVIAASPSRLSRKRFETSHRAEEFGRCLEWAERQVADGRPNEISEVTFPLRLMMSAGTFVDKYGRDENYNILRFADTLSVPLMVTFGELEVRGTNPAFQDLDRDLEDLFSDSRTQVVQVIPGTDHFYSASQEEIAKAIRNWLERKK